ALFHQLARERLGAMCTQVQVALERHEERAIGCRGTGPCARPRAHDVHVTEPALDGLATRDRFGEWAPTGVAGADEEQPHEIRRHRSDPARSRAAPKMQSLPGGSRVPGVQCSQPQSREVTESGGRRRARATRRARRPRSTVAESLRPTWLAVAPAGWPTST